MLLLIIFLIMTVRPYAQSKPMESEELRMIGHIANINKYERRFIIWFMDMPPNQSNIIHQASARIN